MITTLGRPGCSTQKMLELAEELRERNIGLRVLKLGGGDVDTKIPMGAMVFTVMAALAQMDLEVKRERITDSISKRCATDGDRGGRRPTFTDSQVRAAENSSKRANRLPKLPKIWTSRATLYHRIKEQ